MVPTGPERFDLLRELHAAGSVIDEWINVGDSVIVNPDGEFIAGPLREQEGILYAEIDPVQMQAAKLDLDVAGHYAGPDAFQLTVRTGT